MLNHRFLLAPLLAVAACSSDGGTVITPGASLTVVNDSDFVIEEIFLTEVDNPDWGPNLLRGDVLFPNEELALGVPCDFYDALIVDETGVECEVHDLDLCLNDAVWLIRNNTCPVFEAEAKRRAEEAVKASSISL
jgi:hypothetical protein